MIRFACICACMVISLFAFSCSSTSSSLDSNSRVISDVPGTAQIEAAWNSHAASYGFSNLVHGATFGSMYGGSNYATDMFRLGSDINTDLSYDTGLQYGGAGLNFCEFTGDGCGPPPKK